MNHDDDAQVVRILDGTTTIAMVGASPSPDRDSYGVMRFLQQQGYRVIPINPNGGGEILGEKVYGSLVQAPGPFEMVDVFRKSADAGAVADEAVALAREKGIRSIWMQLGVRDDAAAARARAAGLDVVMDRCPKIEYPRLRGRLARTRSGAPGTAR